TLKQTVHLTASSVEASVFETGRSSASLYILIPCKSSPPAA
ncbi:hypothetical protein HKBW3S03_01918, partial [Candidatus Hakubella thermalkaliphila]